MMTERQAWLWIARYMERRKCHYGGICGKLLEYYAGKRIDGQTYKSMDVAIRKAVFRPGRPWNPYLYPETARGSIQRAKFCRRQAERLKVKKGGRP